MDPQIVESVRQLFVLFPAHVTVERIEGYASMLRDFEASDVAAGCAETVKIWKKTLPPPVSMVRERANDARRKRLAGTPSGRLLPAGKPLWWSRYQSMLDEHRHRTGIRPTMSQRTKYLEEAELSHSDT